MRSIQIRVLFVALLVAACPRPLSAQTVSSFDTGFDGWQPIFFGFSWSPNGGHPGGFLQFTEGGIPPFSSLLAPASFLGDWTALDGTGSFRYDFRLFSGTPDSTAGLSVQGPGGTMFWRQPETVGVQGWETVVAPLTQGSWEITSGSWSAILANVTDVRLAPDYFDHTGEITGVDNIALVPEPSSAAMIVVAIVVVGCTRLWIRRKMTQ